MPLVRSVRECGRGGGNMDLANGAFDDRCAGLRDLFRAPASTVPPSCALTNNSAPRSQAERDLGPAQHDLAVQEFKHAGLGGGRFAAAEHDRRHNRVAAVVERD